MNFIKTIINYFKAKKIRKELESYNDKYIALVDYDWESQGFSKELECYEKQLVPISHVCKVPFLKGIDLVLKNKEEKKIIYLGFFSEDIKNLIKQYIILRGYAESAFDINMSTLLKK